MLLSTRVCGVFFSVTFATLSAHAAADSLPPVDRISILRAALRAHPGVDASEQRAHATEVGATASLPAPELMAQVWQVPIARPYAVDEAAMVMVGIGQRFPAPGSLGARARAGLQTAAAERAMADDRARMIRRDADHAFADYVEASARHAIHSEHRAIVATTVSLARARHSTGASLTDVTLAEVELARVEADVIGDGTRSAGARARLNALLGRHPSAPLGPPFAGEPQIAAWDLQTELAKAEESRPQLRAAAAEQRARAEEAQAAAQEAKLPSFSLTALYFAPVGPMPVHGYGANASMSLPWLWGEASSRRDAAREYTKAARSEARAATFPVNGEVAMADSNMRSAALRFQVLKGRALPASHRSFDAAWAGYEAGRTDALTLLSARRAVVDIESEIVMARATLDHALAELDAAVGAPVPRRSIGPQDLVVFEGGS